MPSKKGSNCLVANLPLYLVAYNSNFYLLQTRRNRSFCASPSSHSRNFAFVGLARISRETDRSYVGILLPLDLSFKLDKGKVIGTGSKVCTCIKIKIDIKVVLHVII